jgi:hypothetical protein
MLSASRSPACFRFWLGLGGLIMVFIVFVYLCGYFLGLTLSYMLFYLLR